MDRARRAPRRDLLLASHSFPGPYTIKAFGPAAAEFREGIRAAVCEGARPQKATFSERSTKSGAKICITAEVDCSDVDALIAIYERLYDVPGLSMVL